MDGLSVAAIALGVFGAYKLGAWDFLVRISSKPDDNDDRKRPSDVCGVEQAFRDEMRAEIDLMREAVSRGDYSEITTTHYEQIVKLIAHCDKFKAECMQPVKAAR